MFLLLQFIADFLRLRILQISPTYMEMTWSFDHCCRSHPESNHW